MVTAPGGSRDSALVAGPEENDAAPWWKVRKKIMHFRGYFYIKTGNLNEYNFICSKLAQIEKKTHTHTQKQSFSTGKKKKKIFDVHVYRGACFHCLPQTNTVTDETQLIDNRYEVAHAQ